MKKFIFALCIFLCATFTLPFFGCATSASKEESDGVPQEKTVIIRYYINGRPEKTTQTSIGVVNYAQLDGTKYGDGFLGWTLTINGDDFVTFPYTIPSGATSVNFYAKYDVQITGLPVLQIDTFGAYISETDDYTDCEIHLENTESAYAFSSRSAGIRLRGNSTAGMIKKPYKIKFDQKTSMFGQPANKKWVLLAEYIDSSLLHNYAAHYMGNQLTGIDVKMFFRHVEVYLNGKYQGVYLLTDQVEERPDSRVPIEVSSSAISGATEVPFLISLDANDAVEYDGTNGFYIDNNYAPNSSKKYYYSIKYPDNPTTAQLNYIKNYVASLDSAFLSGNMSYVQEHLDIDSLFDFYLVNELFYNRDAVHKSVYMYKPLNDKMYFGPLWDFDWCLGAPWTAVLTVDENEVMIQEDYFFAPRFSTAYNWAKAAVYGKYNGVAAYKRALAERWEMASEVAKDTVSHVSDYYENYLKQASKNNYDRWYSDEEVYADKVNESQTAYLIKFLTERIEYLDGKFARFKG